MSCGSAAEWAINVGSGGGAAASGDDDKMSPNGTGGALVSSRALARDQYYIVVVLRRSIPAWFYFWPYDDVAPADAVVFICGIVKRALDATTAAYSDRFGREQRRTRAWIVDAAGHANTFSRPTIFRSWITRGGVENIRKPRRPNPRFCF